MNVEKFFRSSVDREKNESFSFGGSEAQMITRHNETPIKFTLIRPRYESEGFISAGHFAWTCRTMQGERKTANVMAGQYQGSHRPTLRCFKRGSAR
jgi:hypothetical protein